MKKISLIAAVFAASVSIACAADSLDFSKIAPHPRLFMKAGAEDTIKQNISTRPGLKALNDAILNSAKAMLKKPPLERNQIGMRILHTSRDMVQRMAFWGYAWRMTGDKAYPERAEKEIRKVAEFKDWNPSHFLDTAEMAFAFAIAYDWFYDAFDAETKKLIAGEIERKALKELYARKYFWRASRHASNWNQVCNSGMLCAALAIYETNPELCGKVVREAASDVERGLRDCYSKDGAYVEGYGYWTYGTSYQVYLQQALVSALGTDAGLYEKYPALLKSAKYMTAMLGPSGMAFNYYDSWLGKGGNPLLLFFAKKTNDSSLLYDEKKFYEPGKVRSGGFQKLFSLIYASDTDFDSVKAPQEKVYSFLDGESPVILARTGWEKEDLFFGIKGGKASTNHGHMDASSFVFDALGERWAFDLGAQDYNSLERLKMNIWGYSPTSDRWKVWRYTNYVHNMLTVNSSLINPYAFLRLEPPRVSGNRVSASLDTGALYAPALKKSARTVSLEDGKFLRVEDTVENAGKESEIRWTMCTHKDARVLDSKTIKITAPSGKTLLAKLVSPSNFKAEILSADSGNSWDTKNPNNSLATFSGKFAPFQKGKIVVELIPQN